MRHFFICFCLLIAFSGYAQDTEAAGNGAQPLPASYRGISLGMSLDGLKSALSQDALFGYRGDKDVSFAPSREESYIETSGSSFVRRALFQTKSDKVYVMTFTLNTSLIDHYSVFTAFVKKYGEPKALDPKQAVWEDDNVRLSLERPLTVKYIDKQTFNKVLDESNAVKNEEIRLREDFLDDF
jgi:hypothetical protein